MPLLGQRLRVVCENTSDHLRVAVADSVRVNIVRANALGARAARTVTTLGIAPVAIGTHLTPVAWQHESSHRHSLLLLIIRIFITTSTITSLEKRGL